MVALHVRPPAVAGQFYPANAAVLRHTVEGYLHNARLPEGLGRACAVVAPHAGYVYSGPTAGYAYKALAALPDRPRTVFLMGPAHRVPFWGVALGSYSALRTPLGDAPVALDVVETMLAGAGLYARMPEAHAAEHCLEVQIPFLQVAVPQARLVPMLFGEVDPARVAEDLLGRLGEDDLIVVSSDLSHYYPYDQARRLDLALLEALVAGRREEVLTGEACGRVPIAALMRVAHVRGWQPELIDYRTSGDTAGDKWQVVGYGSVAFTI